MAPADVFQGCAVKSIEAKFDTKELEAALTQLGKDAGEFVRPAAAAGAEVLYNEAKYRAPVSKEGHWFYGTHNKYWFPAGTLKNSIYMVYSKDNSEAGKSATFHVSWNHQKAPYGFMVENGTSRAPAHPFMRPAYDAKQQIALVVAKDKFTELMEKAIEGN